MNTLFDELPALTFAGTSGWSGSEASEDRALEDDLDGSTKARQLAVLRFVRSQGETGATWCDAGDGLGLHHGMVSSALSNLHRAGLLARLTVRRNRSSVYVAPEFVDGRETAEPKRNVPSAVLLDTIRNAGTLIETGDVEAALMLLNSTLDRYADRVSDV